jgi:perosamine synthetase
MRETKGSKSGSMHSMIPYGRHHIDEEDVQAVADLLRRGPLTQGPAVDAFEAAVADYVGAKYAVAVASCTAALHIGALAAGVGPGKSLVTSPITFVATANAAVYAGGEPLFADIDPHTINLSPDRLRETLAAHSDVRVVSPVHFAGLPCDMVAIKSIADSAGAVVIEDAAHALGATYADGSKVGSGKHSLMTAFSFHPVKAIAAGEGGMITTNDEGVFRSLLRLRSHGINKLDDKFLLPEQAHSAGEPNPWYHEMQQLGFHYRISDVQCALALSQLKKLDRFIARRRQLAATYDAAFAGLEHLRPAQPDGRKLSALHLYVVRINFSAAGISRAALMKELRSRGIGVQVHYIPVPAHPFYRERNFNAENYPEAWSYYQEGLSLPLYYDLTDEQQKYVMANIAGLVG